LRRRQKLNNQLSKSKKWQQRRQQKWCRDRQQRTAKRLLLRWRPRQRRREAGWRGGGKTEETAATVVTECSGHRPTLSMTAKAGAIPARTITANVEAAAAAAAAEVAVVARRIATPPPPTGGGLRFYRVAPTLAVECSTLYTASASSASAHPTNDRKDDDKSGGRGGTHHQCSDCDNVAGYHRRHISRDHD
jgi:hypothetical protein